MSFWTGRVIELAFAFAGAVVVPWAVMRALVPTIEASGVGVRNYRGRQVALGLGLVWIAWAIGVLLAEVLLEVASAAFWSNAAEAPSATSIAAFAPLSLVVGATLVGFADDVFGSGGEKGFSGHLSALGRGRLTTGAFKLLGIGLLALGTTAPRFLVAFAPGVMAGALLQWALAALAIALTANLMNLLDLRPGRALKAYAVLAVLAALGLLSPGIRWDVTLAALVLTFGPLLAVWRFDLGERAMLGDAGANAAGALAGWMAVQALRSTWALAAYVVVVLALNLTSEKVSFSEVIEGDRLLHWLDGLGRAPDDDVARTAGTEVSGSHDTRPEK